jgi:hypothetical protein
MSTAEVPCRENQRKESKQEEGERPWRLVRPKEAKHLGRQDTVARDEDGGYPPLLEDVDWSEMPRSWSRKLGMKVTFKRRHSIPDPLPKPIKSTFTIINLVLVSVTKEVEFADGGINVKDTLQLSIRLDKNDDVSENERKLFYETLLRLRRLPVRLRAAFVRETGYSTRRKETQYQQKKTQFLLLQINECKCRLRREREAARCHTKYTNGRKDIPVRGSVYDLAIEEVAVMYGMTPVAFKKRVERYRKKVPQVGSGELGTKVLFKKSIADEDRIRAPKVMLTGSRLALMPLVKELEFAYKRYNVKETHGPPVWLDSNDVGEKEWKLLYDKLLRIPWLPAKLRASVTREAGYSTREQEAESRQSHTGFLCDQVHQWEYRIRCKRDEARSCKKYANITECNNKYPNLNGGHIRDPRQSWDGTLSPPKPVQGSPHALAIKEIARRYCMTPAALKKRIQRHRTLS